MLMMIDSCLPVFSLRALPIGMSDSAGSPMNRTLIQGPCLSQRLHNAIRGTRADGARLRAAPRPYP
eukprot:4087704-Lingulodinium_polyedra.AAC.1